MNAVLAVALGGACGSVLRYACGLLVQQPWATLLVNLAGSFLIGACVYLLPAGSNPLLRLALVTGILGGFTTFSAFSMDSWLLLQQGQWGQALTYVGASLFGGLLTCAAGVWAGAILLKV